MVELSARRIINRPADTVFEYFSDASNNPKWQTGMQSCEWTSPPPIAIGSTYEQLARFAGRDIRSTFEVTGYEKGRMIEINTVESTFPIRVVRRVTPIDANSCEVSAEISGGPEKGFLKLIEPIMSGRAQKSVDSDYDTLVRALQASASTDSTANSPSE